jgi:hypothetical protein
MFSPDHRGAFLHTDSHRHCEVGVLRHVEKICETCGFRVDDLCTKLAASIASHSSRTDFLCSHNSPLVIAACFVAKAVAIDVFPRFHSAHHNNKLYTFSKNQNLLL